MWRWLGVLAMVGSLAVGLAPVTADERAAWGVVRSVDWQDHTLLVEDTVGHTLVAVDPFGTILGKGLGPMTLSDIRVGDPVDYQVSTWAGMAVADVVHVTPSRQARLPR